MRSIICHFSSLVAPLPHFWNLPTTSSHSACLGSVASSAIDLSQSKSSGASTIITSLLPKM